MPDFKLNSQKEIDNYLQGINQSEFIYPHNESILEEELIDFFIHSTSFTEESRRERIKKSYGGFPFFTTGV